MDKLKINLIPPEIKEQAKKEAKRTLMVRISIGLLGVLIVFTAIILVVIVFQNVTLQALTKQLDEEKSRISGLREKEAVVFFLKNRIDTINKYSNGFYTQEETFALITKLVPPEISVSFLQIDKTQTVSVQGDTQTADSLEVLFNNLMNPAQNEGKITAVSVESLSRSQSGTISFDLKITMSGK